MSGRPSADIAERYGPFRRVILVVVGGVVALAGASASVLLAVLLVTGVVGSDLTGTKGLLGGLAFLAAILLFAALAAIAAVRVMNGVRGRPRARATTIARAEPSYWYPVGLVGWGVLAGIALLGSHHPRALLVSRTFPIERVPWLAFLALLVLPLHVAAHEFGHAAASAVVGFRFVETRIGWFTLKKNGTSLRVAWTPPSIRGVLGFHSAMPQGDRSLVKRWALVAAAGPAASMLAALLCSAGARILGRSTLSSAIVSDALSVGSWVGAGLGVTAAIPVRFHTGLLTDGAIVALALLPGSAARDAELRFLSMWAQGRRPREWGLPPEAFLRAAEAVPKASERLFLAALCVALDTGNEARTDEVLERISAGIPSRDAAMRDELELQIAMVDAFRGNPAAARERLSRAGSPHNVEGYALLARAVVEAAEGSVVAATESLRAWERVIASTGREASVRVGNEWAVERLRQRLAIHRA